MQIIQGSGISGGVVEGRLVFYRPSEENVARRDGLDPDTEWQRVDNAGKTAFSHLETLVRKYAETDEQSARLFEAYEMILKSESLRKNIRHILEVEHCNGEYAVWQAGKDYAARFEALDDDYMRERSRDIMDVTWRFIRGFGSFDEEELPVCGEPVILIADELSAAECAHLDREHVQAVVLRGGSAYSHASIIDEHRGPDGHLPA